MLLAQNNRYLQLLGAMGDSAALSKVEGAEYLSHPYLFTLELYSDKKFADLQSYVGHPQGLRIGDERNARYIHGVITKLQQSGHSEALYRYNVQLEPWLVLLMSTLNSRVYQDINVPDMVCDILKKRGFSDVRLNLSYSYPKREFCMQYRESDFDFVMRQLASAGIFYYFSHEKDKHLLVLADHPSAFSRAPLSTLPYQTLSGQPQFMGLRAWCASRKVIPASVEMSGYNIKNAVPVFASAKARGDYAVNDKLSIYDFAGLEQQQQLNARAALYMEQWESQAGYLEAVNSYPALKVGQRFTLQGDPAVDGNYAVSGQQLVAESNLDSHEQQFSSRVTLLPADKAWRPSLTKQRPSIAGVLSAQVVGPAQEEIHVDEMGRIKLQFHWDKEHKKDDNSSCWIRVSQLGNGVRFGTQFLPRVGSEVLVSFVDGDPDYPIVVGTVMNGAKMPPFSLPEQKTQSGLTTRSSRKGNVEQGHQLCFEDKKGEEFILIHSQKDLQWQANNDLSAVIARDVRWEIKGKRDVLIDKGDDSLTLSKGNKNQMLNKGNFVTLLNSGNYSLNAKGGKVDISAGQACTITAKQKIELRVGNSSLSITPAGITVKGPVINIKSDGMLKMTAASTTVEGTGMLTLKSNGMTKLSGLVVQISASTIAMLKGLLTKIG
ncbi:type VI secretion system Vgr family protein [Arsenophonus nasoniae]|uniref:Type VI secretion system tip protein TssI/VgrG n=1 Tax=Arsenophonus nasoniae TaxID=638 RepID=A0AA95K7M8_9GAMM|nr:type VI secretion system tip protein TssI/VgrG [Arsenophonus nasoniae]WGL95042.1 type VI secretion system tip protein TssI/VgrG [Arsenophonus nasoniae]